MNLKVESTKSEAGERNYRTLWSPADVPLRPRWEVALGGFPSLVFFADTC